jgi:hypothetical protein
MTRRALLTMLLAACAWFRARPTADKTPSEVPSLLWFDIEERFLPLIDEGETRFRRNGTTTKQPGPIPSSPGHWKASGALRPSTAVGRGCAPTVCRSPPY